MFTVVTCKGNRSLWSAWREVFLFLSLTTDLWNGNGTAAIYVFKHLGSSISSGGRSRALFPALSIQIFLNPATVLSCCCQNAMTVTVNRPIFLPQLPSIGRLWMLMDVTAYPTFLEFEAAVFKHN